MPLITNEPDVSSADPFELDLDVAPWGVAHVRSRCEKALARHLYDHEVPFYLPLQDKCLHHSGRQRLSRIPLFPGYVFLRGGRLERLAALRSQRIVRMVPVPDQVLIDRELSELRRLQEDGFLLKPHPYLRPGDPVEILEGSFKGYRGSVVRERRADRLVVSVTFLRRSVTVEIDRASLRPLTVNPVESVVLDGRSTRSGAAVHATGLRAV